MPQTGERKGSSIAPQGRVLSRRQSGTSVDLQRAFDAWRGLQQASHGDRHGARRPLRAEFARTPVLPAIDYARDQVRKVQDKNRISFRGREWRVGRAFIGEPVALRPTGEDGVWCIARSASAR
jgi:hypothetical protein